MSRVPQHIWEIIFQKNWPLYIIVILILCLGIIVGSLTACSIDGLHVGDLQSMLNMFLKQIESTEIHNGELIKTSILNNILLLIIIYFLGLTIIGLPILLILIFARGFILGFAVGFLLREKAFKGIILALVAILPQNLFYLPALVVGGATALSFTICLVKRNFNQNIKLWPGFLCYNGLMLTVVIIALSSSFIEAYITPFLTKFAVRLMY